MVIIKLSRKFNIWRRGFNKKYFMVFVLNFLFFIQLRLCKFHKNNLFHLKTFKNLQKMF